ncbi:hypothetical protein ACIHCQ_44345, partial [Streptomyces sp. NPDC052236]|uniref:hypothetical protein n=1 Tax=Streptomyces sp. NPDC052236 TaxID=3365686 RepID=UPI0037D0C8D8
RPVRPDPNPTQHSLTLTRSHYRSLLRQQSTTLADYLLHIGEPRRRFAAVPASTWRALLTTTDDPHVLVRIGWSAQWRLLYELAEEFYVAAGTEGALPRARLLMTRGRAAAARQLAESVIEQRPDEAMDLLITWSQRETPDQDRRIAELSQYASVHDPAAQALAQELESAGRYDEAVEQWTRLAAGGDGESARRAAEVLTERDRVAAAVTLLRSYAGASPSARRMLVDLLLREGTPGNAAEVEHLLRAWLSDSSVDGMSDAQLVELLYTSGRMDELESMAMDGSRAARHRMMEVWVAESGHAPSVADHAKAVCARWNETSDAPWTELHLLRRLGNLEQAVDVALAFERDHGGNDDLNAVVTSMLMELDRWDEVVVRADRGDSRAQDVVAQSLVEQGRIDEVARRAERGELPACHRLSDWLESCGKVTKATDVWRGALASGEEDARYWLVGLLEKHERVDELLDLLRAESRRLGKREARLLASLLVKTGRIAELMDRVSAGDQYADTQLIHHLVDTGRGEEVCRRAVAGSGTATRVLLHAAMSDPALCDLASYGLQLDGSVATPRGED